MAFSLTLLLFVTFGLKAVRGDLFDPCFKEAKKDVWCFGVKDNVTVSEAGKGCFSSKDCIILIIATLEQDKSVKWTVSGHGLATENFGVFFTMTASPFEIISRTSSQTILFVTCGQLNSGQLKISYVTFIGKGQNVGNAVPANGDSGYRTNPSDPQYEIINGKRFLSCQYLSKSRIQYKTENPPYLYDIDLASTLVYPWLFRLASLEIVNSWSLPHIGWSKNAVRILNFGGASSFPTFSTSVGTANTNDGRGPSSKLWIWLAAGLFVFLLLVAAGLLAFFFYKKRNM